MGDLQERFMRRGKSPEECATILVHETLHEVVQSDDSNIPNTTFVEALFDALSGRGETGLWFAQEVFERIQVFLREVD